MKTHSLIATVQNALDYIELNILEDMTVDMVAANGYMSTSALYKVFSAVFDTTIKDYIRMRRLSLSAYDLVNTDLSVLEIGVKYRYGTYESYSRAFKKLFGSSPSLYRKNAQYIEVFPGVQLFEHQRIDTLEGEIMSIEKHMNREKLNEIVSSAKTGYVLDIDIDRFQEVNDKYGYDIGNKVLIAVPSRIENVLRENGLNSEVVRINNDEFAVILKEVERADMEALAIRLVKSMDAPLEFESQTVNISISIGIAEFKLKRDGSQTVDHANMAMIEAKRAGRNTFKFYRD